MSQQKAKHTVWRMGLLVLMCVALLVVATGTTFARYRTERERKLNYQVRVPEQIVLGTVHTQNEDGDTSESQEEFVASNQLLWETEQGVTKLEFAVSNGLSGDDYSHRSQMIQLRMIGTLGIWLGSDTPKICLELPPEAEGEEKRVVYGTVTPLAEGTALHQTYGAGWMYTFEDEDGDELTWTLDGGKLSYISFSIAIDGETPSDLSLLQPYVIAEAIDE